MHEVDNILRFLSAEGIKSFASVKPTSISVHVESFIPAPAPVEPSAPTPVPVPVSLPPYPSVVSSVEEEEFPHSPEEQDAIPQVPPSACHAIEHAISMVNDNWYVEGSALFNKPVDMVALRAVQKQAHAVILKAWADREEQVDYRGDEEVHEVCSVRWEQAWKVCKNEKCRVKCVNDRQVKTEGNADKDPGGVGETTA
ncbi:hypothetical protein FQN51_009500 [Onygenales sp. PD_10]|nr:hypothetical protein FQN51_009500 [Onygenales sp. PD_10]